MKVLLLLISLAFANISYSQVAIEFAELDYGLAILHKGPPGESSADFVEKTESIKLAPKASFGILYMLKAADSTKVDVDIEWIFPKKMIDNNGKKSKSIRYTAKKPTNYELGNTYTFDEPYEMIEGKWTLNIYYENKKLYSRTFVVHK